jgi:hypothetical protein
VQELVADPACNAGIAARIQNAGMAWDSVAAFGDSRMLFKVRFFKVRRIALIRIAVSLAQQ